MTSLVRRKHAASNVTPGKQDLVRRFSLAIDSINVHFQEIQHFWAKGLGISRPQWMILTAIADLDQGQGASVKVVSKMLHVDPSFITTQTKILEKKGLMRRKTSPDDARVVQMSLTDKTCKHFASLVSQQQSLSNFIFAELDGGALAELTGKLVQLTGRFEKASLKLSLDL